MRLVADDRSNSVLLSGEKSQRLKAKTLIAHLDTPLDNGGDTRVRYLRYADAEKIAAKLKEQISGTTAAPAAAGRRAGDRRQEHDHLGRARDQCAGDHGAAEDHALADEHHRQARHPPRAGAGRGDHRRGDRRQVRRARRELADRRHQRRPGGRRLHRAGRRRQHRRPGARRRRPEHADRRCPAARPSASAGWAAPASTSRR